MPKNKETRKNGSKIDKLLKEKVFLNEARKLYLSSFESNQKLMRIITKGNITAVALERHDSTNNINAAPSQRALYLLNFLKNR
jgi:hypothetical protein